MKDFLKTTIVAGTAIAMLALSSVSASAACLAHTHTGYAQNTLGYAKAQAKADWIAQVTAHDGAVYVQTPPSGFSCTKYDGSLQIFSCTVVAYPCGNTVFNLKNIGKLPFTFRP